MIEKLLNGSNSELFDPSTSILLLCQIIYLQNKINKLTFLVKETHETVKGLI